MLSLMGGDLLMSKSHGCCAVLVGGISGSSVRFFIAILMSCSVVGLGGSGSGSIRIMV